MPIRLNLLAETQIAEESRRTDPVKRAILAGIVVICAVVVWSSTVQIKIFSARSDFNGLQTSWKSIEKGYQSAIDTRHEFMEAQEKLAALQQLTTNRFLWGTTLNALQQTLNGIDDVQVLRVNANQTYTFAEEVKAKPGDTHGGKPATATERIIMTIDGVDSSPQPGSRINKFKAGIAGEPFFQSSLKQTNGVTLLSFSPPSPSVKFSLQCLFSEKVR